MTPRRREIDWLALLAERPGSAEEARRIEADPGLARRFQSLRGLVDQLRRYRREQPVTADDLLEAAEGRAGAAVLERIEADPELRSVVETVRAVASEPLGETPTELPPLPAAIHERLAEPAPAISASARERLARTLRALGHSTAAAARRAAEIVTPPESVAPAPAASRDLTRAGDEEGADRGPKPSEEEGRSEPVPGKDED